MNIAMLAHDGKKELMIHFCSAYRGTLSKHTICATSRTGKIISDSTGIIIEKCLSAELGGEEQICSKISCNEIDLVFFFREPSQSFFARESEIEILRLCDAHNVPVATNIATGEALIHSLERGDLDWRNILKI
ncbi:MAG: methylglyoxal synthase [Oscillospiraceae bacterium]